MSLSHKRRGQVSALAAFAFSLALYALTAPRGLTWDLGGADGGELAAVVFTGGIAHPPGYPTYTLLAQAARLLPGASFAHQLNLFSALCGSLTTALLALSALRLWQHQHRDDEIPAALRYFLPFTAAALFAVTEVVWTQSVITEVYALAGLFCAAIITLGISGYTDGSINRTRWLTLGVLTGVGLGAHYMVGFAALFVLGLWLLIDSKHISRALWAIPGGLLGLLVYLYLPLRAGLVPLLNWGNPVDWSGFWWLVSGAAYSDRLGLAALPAGLGGRLHQLYETLGVMGLAAALAGVLIWFDRSKPLAIAALILIAANLGFMAAYQSDDTFPYVYPLLMVLCMGSVTALAALYKTLANITGKQHAVALTGIAVVLMTGFPAIRSYGIVRGATIEAETYAYTALTTPAGPSVMMTDEDTKTFALMYGHLVVGIRPDVVPVDTRLLQFDWYRAGLIEGYPELGLASQDEAALQFAFVLADSLPPDYTVVWDLSEDGE